MTERNWQGTSPEGAEEEPPEDRVPAIVGVGASAGGLDAFRQLLAVLPSETGLAFAFVQHLAPGHESRLPEILRASTDMPVTQAEDGVEVEPNHVYVIPPGMLMEVGDGVLTLAGRAASVKHMPVDHFFRSLADRAGDRAIGVVLSGNASDGTEGLRQIQAVGGVTIAQEPETAEYGGMPRSAISAGVVDLVLDPKQTAEELARLAAHPYVRRRPEPAEPDEAVGPEERAAAVIPKTEEAFFRRVFGLLRQATGVDFGNYKSGTFRRRLHRRMMLSDLPSLEAYVAHLEDHPEEVGRLYEDLLIHVTRFFRNPEAFEALKERVLPEIVKERQHDDPIRFWVAGCATGEEAYSVAIILLEFLGGRSIETPIQIFATDVYDSGISHARSGVYREGIAADVSEERLRRFFTPAPGGYQIAKAVRDLCVFSRHDLTRDPPFSRIDLLVCRNVLIYMSQSLQDRLLSGFHYALKPSGFLMLGEAEAPGQDDELFSPVDKRHRLYARRQATPRIHHHFPPAGPELHRAGPFPPPETEPAATRIQREADRFIISHFGPPAVVVDDRHTVHYIRGSTGAFLQPAPGEPTHNLMKMAREGLLHGLRAVLHEAKSTLKPAKQENLQVRSDSGELNRVTVEAVPLRSGENGTYFLVLFEPPGSSDEKESADGNSPTAAEPEPPPSADEKDRRIHELEEELTASRSYLQSVIQDLEATNEELQTANEEILSANEELQSTNEELDTAREELQSTNEELNTLNDELHGRNQELARANSDLLNLLASVQLATVIVDHGLKIRRFTPPAEGLMNLIQGDIDRPIGHISPNFACDDLEELVRRAVDEIDPVEREVRGRQSHDGRWYSLRVKPYKSVDQKIEGAVLTLFEITELKRWERELDRLRRYAEAVIETAHEPLIVLSGSGLRVETVNRSFCDMFGVTREMTVRRSLYELGNRQWDIPELREALSHVQESEEELERFTVTHEFPGIGRRTMRLNARTLAGDEEREEMILLAIEDVTRRDEP